MPQLHCQKTILPLYQAGDFGVVHYVIKPVDFMVMHLLPYLVCCQMILLVCCNIVLDSVSVDQTLCNPINSGAG